MSTPWSTNNPGIGGLDELTTEEEAIIESIASLGSAGQSLVVNGSADGVEWSTPAGGGDVSASSNFGTDNVLVRSDGTTKNVQSTGIAVADTTNDVSGVGDLALGGYIDLDEISTPTDPSANIGRLYVADDGGTTTLYFRDSAGTETDLLAGGSGDVTISGTPANNQIAVWTSSSAIEGDSDLTFDGTNLTVTGDVNGLTLQENTDGFEISGGSSSERTLTITGGNITLTGGASTKGDLLVSDGTDFDSVGIGSNGQVLTADSAETRGLKWTTISGTGDVTASANMTDNTVVRGDGGAKGVQDTGVSIDDSNNVSGVVNITQTGYIDMAEISTPTDPSANVARIYVADDGGTTKLYFRDSAGTETEVGSGGGGTLDESYDTGGSGAGRSITADSGAVAITVPDASNNVGLTVTQNDSTNNVTGIHVVSSIDTGTSDQIGELTIENTSGNAAGPFIDYYHNSASPADNDYMGQHFHFNNSVAEKVYAGGFSMEILDVADGEEDTDIYFRTLAGGTNEIRMEIGSVQGSVINGISIGSTTAAGVITSRGNQNLILQAGNSTSGTITIVDGANGDIEIDPDGTGRVKANGNDIPEVTSGDGAPSSTPSAVGDMYLDTTNNRTYFAFGTTDYNDWRYVATTANPYTPPAADNMVFEDGVNNIIFEDGNNMTFEGDV